MTFDAGSIEATLTLKRTQMQQDLTWARQQGAQFAREKFEATLGFNDKAVDAAIATMQAKFAALRSELEKGINLSVHEKTSGSGGSAAGVGIVGSDPMLLKKLEQEAATPGGIGILGTGTDTTLNRLLRMQLEKQAQQGGPAQLGTGVSGTDTQRVTQQVTQKVVNAAAAPGTVTQKVKEELVGPDVTQGLGGTVTEKVRLDTSDVDSESKAAGDESGSSFANRFKMHMKDLYSGSGGGGGDDDAEKGGEEAGDSFAMSFIKQTTFGMKGAILTGVGSILALLPALGGLAATGLVLGLGVGLASKLPGVGNEFKAFGSSALSTLEQTVKPLVPYITDALHELLSFIKEIAPEITEIFKVLGPSLQPFVNAIQDLVAGLLPGMLALFKAIQPVLTPILSIFGTLGSQLGDMFKDFSEALGPSTTVFTAVFDAIGQLLPVLGRLGDIFAQTLAPILKVFFTAFQALEPLLLTVGNIVAGLAGAVFSSFSGVLQTLVGAIKDLEPGIRAVTGAFSLMFAALENSGVIFELEDAIEKLAQPLATLINALLIGLAPVLPVLITAFAQLLAGISGGLEVALLALIKAVTPLIKPFTDIVVAVVDFTSHLGPALPIILGIVLAFIKLTDIMAIARAGMALFTGIMAAFAAVTDLDTIALAAMYAWDKLVTIATGAWDAIQGLLDIELDANPIGLVVLAIAALVAAIVLLIKNWSTIAGLAETAWNDVYDAVSHAISNVVNFLAKAWDDIYGAVQAAWNAILNWLQNWWYVLLLGIIGGAFGLIIALIIKYHQDILNAIEAAWNAIYAFVKGILGDIGGFLEGAWADIEKVAEAAWNDIKSFFTSWWSAELGAFKSALGSIGDALSSAWSSMESGAKTVWNDIKSFFDSVWSGIKSGFDNGVAAIKSVWATLKSVFSGPVDFLINTVYDNGIARLWNDVMSKLGGPQLPIIKGFQEGGRIPGYGGGDRRIISVEDGETIVPKHLTHFLAPVFKMLGIPGFSEGGIVGEAEAIGKMLLASATGNEKAFSNAFDGAVSGLFGGGGAKGSLATMMIKMPEKIISDAIDSVWSSIVGGGGGAGPPSGKGPAPMPGGGDPAANAALAKKMMPSWASGLAWTDWNNVAMRESGWSQFADNPSSNAYGIPQALPFNKMPKAAWPASAGGSSNPGSQISWMVGYMSGRYGGPQGAWAHELSNGWYDRGGNLPPGYTLAHNQSGRNEQVLSPDESEAFISFVKGGGLGSLGQQMERLISATHAQSNRTASALAQALNFASNTAFHVGQHQTPRWVP